MRMLSPRRNFSPAATKLNASEVGPTSAISSAWQFSNCAPSLRASSSRCITKASWSPSVLCSRAFGNRVGHAARQRADAGMREENFIARDGEFAPAQFLVGENFGQSHPARLIGAGSVRKAELKSGVERGIKITRVELDDFVGNDAGHDDISQSRRPRGEELQLERAFLLSNRCKAGAKFHPVCR